MCVGEVGAALDRAQLVGPEAQLPAGRDPRILLPQRAGGGVAGIDERPGAGLGLAAVELLEGRDRHVDLAPNLDDVGSPAAGSWRGMADIVITLAVTSSPTSPSPRVAARVSRAALVQQAHGQAVDLELAGVGHHHPRCSGPCACPRPAAPRSWWSCPATSSACGAGPRRRAATARRRRPGWASRAGPARARRPRGRASSATRASNSASVISGSSSTK